MFFISLKVCKTSTGSDFCAITCKDCSFTLKNGLNIFSCPIVEGTVISLSWHQFHFAISASLCGSTLKANYNFYHVNYILFTVVNKLPSSCFLYTHDHNKPKFHPVTLLIHGIIFYTYLERLPQKIYLHHQQIVYYKDY